MICQFSNEDIIWERTSELNGIIKWTNKNISEHLHKQVILYR